MIVALLILALVALLVLIRRDYRRHTAEKSLADEGERPSIEMHDHPL